MPFSRKEGDGNPEFFCKNPGHLRIDHRVLAAVNHPAAGFSEGIGGEREKQVILPEVFEHAPGNFHRIAHAQIRLEISLLFQQRGGLRIRRRSRRPQQQPGHVHRSTAHEKTVSPMGPAADIQARKVCAVAGTKVQDFRIRAAGRCFFFHKRQAVFACFDAQRFLPGFLFSMPRLIVRHDAHALRRKPAPQQLGCVTLFAALESMNIQNNLLRPVGNFRKAGHDVSVSFSEFPILHNLSSDLMLRIFPLAYPAAPASSICFGWNGQKISRRRSKYQITEMIIIIKNIRETIDTHKKFR